MAPAAHSRYLYNALWYGLAPASPLVIYGTFILVIAICTTAEADSWWRTGWLAQLLWTFDTWLSCRRLWEGWSNEATLL